MGAEQVGAAAFETRGRGGGSPILAVEVADVRHHVPAILVEAQIFQPFAAAIEQGQALWPQHPLVAVGHDEIRLHGLHVEGAGADALDGIDTEQDVARATGLTQ